MTEFPLLLHLNFLFETQIVIARKSLFRCSCIAYDYTREISHLRHHYKNLPAIFAYVNKINEFLDAFPSATDKGCKSQKHKSRIHAECTRKRKIHLADERMEIFISFLWSRISLSASHYREICEIKNKSFELKYAFVEIKNSTRRLMYLRTILPETIH